MENNQILKQYYKAKLKLQIAEEEVKELGDQLTTFLLEQEGNKADIPEARFTLRKTITYKYSPKVTTKEEELNKKTAEFNEKMKLHKEILKTMMETEVSEGTAEKINEKLTPVMTPVKEK